MARVKNIYFKDERLESKIARMARDNHKGFSEMLCELAHEALEARASALASAKQAAGRGE